ncbi:MAG: YitT family protein [Clostridia bacterium]|nr:YitT family protein [Clostridia bacterium]
MPAFIRTKKQTILTVLREIGHLLAGNLLVALGFDLFFAGNSIAAGGFSGLGLVVSHYLPVSVGTVVFVISVPVLVWSFFVQGWRYTLSALASTAALSAFTDLFAALPTVTNNLILASLCGGALYGLGAAVLVRGRVSGSGTDLLGRLLITKFRVLTLGTFVMLIDAAVILLSVFTFGDLETGIYAALSIAVCSWVTDACINGFNKAYLFQIITDVDASVLAAAVSEQLDRTVTLVPARGMYRQEERNLLLAVVSPGQVYEMKDILRALAPDAFVVLSPASEILGEGFHGVDVTIPLKDLKNRT